MDPDKAKFLLQFFLPQLESEHDATISVMASVPLDNSDYKPNEKCKTALGLAWHIAAVEMWFLDAALQRRFGDTAPRPAELKTCRDVAEWYAQEFLQPLPLLSASSGEDLATPVDFIGLRNDPAVAYVNIAISHSVYHRGQLSTYLRAMGAKMPAIYVESADEPYPPTTGSAAAESGQRPPAF